MNYKVVMIMQKQIAAFIEKHLYLHCVDIEKATILSMHY